MSSITASHSLAIQAIADNPGARVLKFGDHAIVAGHHLGLVALFGLAAYVISNPYFAAVAAGANLFTYYWNKGQLTGVPENGLPPKYNGRPHRYSPNLPRIIRYVARKTGLRKIPDIHVGSIQEALHDNIANAFAMGDKKKSAISTTPSLLKYLNDDEERAVFGHEATHILGHHTKNTYRSKMLGHALRQLTVLNMFYSLFFVTLASFGTALLLHLGAVILSNAVSLNLQRQMEFISDRGAIRMTGNPLAMAVALAKVMQTQFNHSDILARSLAVGDRKRNQRVYNRWNKLSSHPTLHQRITRLLRMVGSLKTRQHAELIARLKDLDESVLAKLAFDNLGKSSDEIMQLLNQHLQLNGSYGYANRNRPIPSM